MYTRAIAVGLYPEACTGGRFISGQRRSICINRLCSREHAPIGFWCGGFTSTAGYDSGNEAQLASSDCATSEADQVLEARPVFIRAPRKSFFNLSFASLSASAWGVNSNREIRLRLLSNDASPRRSPLPSPVAFP
jgi:hypothetical protein